ncbi:MAG: hypothetical protein M9894_02185 [Planctomycetes bacterium]|nr:hypothetical protein [Planctomycetota bacterium]
MVRLLDPSLTLIAEVRASDLAEFLTSRDLVALPTSIAGSQVVTDRTIAALVDPATRPSNITIERSPDRLLEKFRTALASGSSVLFEPTLRAMRGYFNTAGFIRAMTEITDQLPEAALLVPPGLYGRQHVLGLKPRHLVGSAPTR